MLDKVFPKIHSEGYKFLAIAIFITIFLNFLSTFFGSILSGRRLKKLGLSFGGGGKAIAGV